MTALEAVNRTMPAEVPFTLAPTIPAMSGLSHPGGLPLPHLIRRFEPRFDSDDKSSFSGVLAPTPMYQSIFRPHLPTIQQSVANVASSSHPDTPPPGPPPPVVGVANSTTSFLVKDILSNRTPIHKPIPRHPSSCTTCNCLRQQKTQQQTQSPATGNNNNNNNNSSHQQLQASLPSNHSHHLNHQHHHHHHGPGADSTSPSSPHPPPSLSSSSSSSSSQSHGSHLPACSSSGGQPPHSFPAPLSASVQPLPIHHHSHPHHHRHQTPSPQGSPVAGNHPAPHSSLLKFGVNSLLSPHSLSPHVSPACTSSIGSSAFSDLRPVIASLGTLHRSFYENSLHPSPNSAPRNPFLPVAPSSVIPVPGTFPWPGAIEESD
ncbi:uncharacterized protein [Diadema antillarum]|uniref:uncharacterized protein n=1 Tax=Diadema antillarum TaxID=105358 RepID=UPI003A851012